MKRVFLSLLLSAIAMLLAPTTTKAASVYYVSTTGSDSNVGTDASPFKTISKGKSVLQVGDELRIHGGTYNERFDVGSTGTAASPITIKNVDGETVIVDGTGKSSPTVGVSGSYVTISGITVTKSPGTCVSLTGQYLTANSLTVNDCTSHGIQTSGSHITVQNSTVYHSVLENSARTWSSGWGSAFKAYVGSNDVTFKNNTAYNNYGEGIAVTRGVDVKVLNNFFYDNYSVNLYIDNSKNVLVDSNLSTCTTNTAYLRNGNRPSAISIGEESYSGWGAQLSDITITNNILAYCRLGINYPGSDVSGGGLVNVTIANNTLWGGNWTGMYLAADPNTSGTLIENNIFHNDGSRGLCWIDDLTGITIKNNLWLGGLPDSSTSCNGTNDQTEAKTATMATTPVYNDGNTFKVVSTSKAINKGASINLTHDFFGATRPYGGTIDIGAHEYGSTVTTTPSPSPSVAASPTAKPGDADGNNIVNGVDYTIWFNHYNQSVSGASNGDFSNNGKVDGQDYVIWFNNYGK